MHVSPTDIKFRIMGYRKIKGAQTYGIIAKGYDSRAQAENDLTNLDDKVEGYVSDDRRIVTRLTHDLKHVAEIRAKERDALIKAQAEWDADHAKTA